MCVCVLNLYNIFNLCGSFLKIIIFICVCKYTFFFCYHISHLLGFSFGSLSTFYLQIKSIKSRWCVNTSTNFIFYSFFCLLLLLCSSTQRLNFLSFFCSMKNVPDENSTDEYYIFFGSVRFITKSLA